MVFLGTSNLKDSIFDTMQYLRYNMSISRSKVISLFPEIIYHLEASKPKWVNSKRSKTILIQLKGVIMVIFCINLQQK